MLAVGSGTVGAQSPLGTGELSTGPLCNVLVQDCGGVAPVYDPPVTSWDDPRIAIQPAGNPNPVLDFGLILGAGSFVPPRGQDMNQPLCLVPPGPC